VGIYRALAANRPGTVLLESAEQGKRWAATLRGVRSAGVLTERDGGACGRRGAARHHACRDPLGGPARPRLRSLAERPDLPPLTGGLVGYLATTSCAGWSGCPAPPPTTSACPSWR
jgi:anthranilate synthase component 1